MFKGMCAGVGVYWLYDWKGVKKINKLYLYSLHLPLLLEILEFQGVLCHPFHLVLLEDQLGQLNQDVPLKGKEINHV